MISVLASKVVKFSSHSHKGSGPRLCPHQKAGENQDHDLTDEPGVPQRQWPWRQSEALYTIPSQLLPLTGAKRRLLARILDHFYHPDQAGQSLPRSVDKLPWGGVPGPTLPEFCTTRYTSLWFSGTRAKGNSNVTGQRKQASRTGLYKWIFM